MLGYSGYKDSPGAHNNQEREGEGGRSAKHKTFPMLHVLLKMKTVVVNQNCMGCV